MIRIALASSDGKFIDKHFGKCESFSIADLKEGSLKYEIIETRNTKRMCSAQGHTQEGLENIISLLSDCKYVVVSRIGIWIVSELKAHAIEPIELFGPVEEAIKIINSKIKN